eukprot:scaffold59067_cov75-Cyclotella_meneghiniana.AAC.7
MSDRPQTSDNPIPQIPGLQRTFSNTPEDDSSHQSTSQHSYNNSQGSSGTKDGCFFADMTLDIEDAQLESTPRSEMKFATMTPETSINAVAGE